MRSKGVLCYFLLSFLPFTNLPAQRYLPESHQEQVIDESDDDIQALASLVFYTQEWEEILKSGNPTSHEKISFSIEDVTKLWEKAGRNLYGFPATADQIQRAYHFEKAYSLHDKAKNLVIDGKENEALDRLNASLKLLRLLWGKAIELEEIAPVHLTASSTILRNQSDPNIENNPYISPGIRKKMGRYLLPLRHPMRKILDDLCLEMRVTADKGTFRHSGFITIANRPRSYIRVAKHSMMPGYLVKVYLDTVLNEKQHKPSWKWLVYRCIGAEKIRTIIKKRHMKYFVVASKWIYCFPPNPSPPLSLLYTRHLALLLVTDMDLVQNKENLDAWKSKITEKHLDELYFIISRAKGSSYRPDNIAYTNQGKFAFIDTEYPSRGPDFERIRHYLNHEMRDYWDHLVKHGGH